MFGHSGATRQLRRVWEWMTCIVQRTAIISAGFRLVTFAPGEKTKQWEYSRVPLVSSNWQCEMQCEMQLMRYMSFCRPGSTGVEGDPQTCQIDISLLMIPRYLVTGCRYTTDYGLLRTTYRLQNTSFYPRPPRHQGWHSSARTAHPGVQPPHKLKGAGVAPALAPARALAPGPHCNTTAYTD